MRSSSARSTVPELNDGEGIASTARGGPPGHGGALRPATWEGGMVSRAVHGGRGNRKQGWWWSAYRRGQEVEGVDNLQHGKEGWCAAAAA
jgi:hypothetical protein